MKIRTIKFNEINNDCIIIVNKILFGRYGDDERSVYTMVKRDFTGEDNIEDSKFIDYIYNDQDEYCYILSFMDEKGYLYVVEN